MMAPSRLSLSSPAYCNVFLGIAIGPHHKVGVNVRARFLVVNGGQLDPGFRATGQG